MAEQRAAHKDACLWLRLGEIRVGVCESKVERVQLRKSNGAAVCMLHLVVCQETAAGDSNTIKLKAIVSALPFVSVPPGPESYYS